MFIDSLLMLEKRGRPNGADVEGLRTVVQQAPATQHSALPPFPRREIYPSRGWGVSICGSRNATTRKNRAFAVPRTPHRDVPRNWFGAPYFALFFAKEEPYTRIAREACMRNRPYAGAAPGRKDCVAAE